MNLSLTSHNTKNKDLESAMFFLKLHSTMQCTICDTREISIAACCTECSPEFFMFISDFTLLQVVWNLRWTWNILTCVREFSRHESLWPDSEWSGLNYGKQLRFELVQVRFWVIMCQVDVYCGGMVGSSLLTSDVIHVAVPYTSLLMFFELPVVLIISCSHTYFNFWAFWKMQFTFLVQIEEFRKWISE